MTSSTVWGNTSHMTSSTVWGKASIVSLKYSGAPSLNSVDIRGEETIDQLVGSAWDQPGCERATTTETIRSSIMRSSYCPPPRINFQFDSSQVEGIRSARMLRTSLIVKRWFASQPQFLLFCQHSTFDSRMPQWSPRINVVRQQAGCPWSPFSSRLPESKVQVGERGLQWAKTNDSAQ